MLVKRLTLKAPTWTRLAWTWAVNKAFILLCEWGGVPLWIRIPVGFTLCLLVANLAWTEEPETVWDRVKETWRGKS